MRMDVLRLYGSVAAMGFSLGITACDKVEEAGASVSSSVSQEAVPNLGYDELQLGMSAEDVSRIANSNIFSRDGLDECLAKAGKQKCILTARFVPPADLASYMTISDMEFGPVISFDVSGKAESVSLNHDNRRGTVAKCRAGYEELVDWAVPRYGTFVSTSEGQKANMMSPGGNPYPGWDEFGMSVMRTVRDVDTVNFEDAPGIWDRDQAVWIHARWDADAQTCSLSINYREPIDPKMLDG